MIYRIELNNNMWELTRNSDEKVVSKHETMNLAEYAMNIRYKKLDDQGNLCECYNWKGEDYDTCYECKID